MVPSAGVDSPLDRRHNLPERRTCQVHRPVHVLRWMRRKGETMSDRGVCQLMAHDLAGRIRQRDVSPVEVVEAHLRRIDALNPRLSAFFTLTGDRALEEARQGEAEIAAGRWRGPLHGIPYGAKDIIETAGVRTTHGSSFFRDHVPAEDAECIARLKRAGAIMLGKTLTHEFASAATTINPHYGTAHNPWNLDRITGGSSGGSGAAGAGGARAAPHWPGPRGFISYAGPGPTGRGPPAPPAPAPPPGGTNAPREARYLL